MNQELMWKTFERQKRLKNYYEGVSCLYRLTICLLKNLAKKGLDHGLATRILSSFAEQPQTVSSS